MIVRFTKPMSQRCPERQPPSYFAGPLAAGFAFASSALSRSRRMASSRSGNGRAGPGPPAASAGKHCLALLRVDSSKIEAGDSAHRERP